MSTSLRDAKVEVRQVVIVNGRPANKEEMATLQQAQEIAADRIGRVQQTHERATWWLALVGGINARHQKIIA
jgi:hypothetical protein